jgi:hypothetical protein
MFVISSVDLQMENGYSVRKPLYCQSPMLMEGTPWFICAGMSQGSNWRWRILREGYPFTQFQLHSTALLVIVKQLSILMMTALK